MPLNRRGLVTASGTTLSLTMRDTQLSCNPPSRPVVGANQDGVHYAPKTGDHVMVLGEQAGWTTTSVGTLNPDPRVTPAPAMQPGTTSCFSNGVAVWTASGGKLSFPAAVSAPGYIVGPQPAATIDQSGSVFPAATWPVTIQVGGAVGGHLQLMVPATGTNYGSGILCDLVIAAPYSYGVGPLGSALVLATWASPAYAQSGKNVLQLLAAVQPDLLRVRFAIDGTVTTGQAPLLINYIVFAI
jgi:hypothetical protein